MKTAGLPEIPAKYRAPARALFDNLARRLGPKDAANFVGDSLIPFVQVATGVAPSPAVARALAAAIIEDLYDTTKDGDGVTPRRTGDGLPPARPSERGEGTPSPKPEDFDGIRSFRNSQDCRNWPVTVAISNVRIEGGNIAWDEAKGQREARKWNVKTGKKSVNGETILLLPSISTAGMFDFLGVGQTRKILSNLQPSHEGPGFFPGWVPVKGERVGFCIATISRDRSAAKMQERSNVVWFSWE